jgi:hypothetical protein
MDSELATLDDGDQELCCEFTAFKDGTFSCSLYLGFKTVPQDFNVHTTEQFSALMLKHL